MAEHLIVGTDDGLHDLRRDNGEWRIAGRFLEGCEINGVAADHGNGKLYVATRNKGVQRVDLVSGACERVGGGMVPDTTRCVALDPNDAQRIFVGAEPTSVFFSFDGGATWDESQQIKEIGVARSWKYHVDFIAPHLRYILVSRANPDHVYGAVQIGGVVRSEDGGRTWEDVVEGIDPDVHMIAQDPNDPDTIYAVCGGGGYPGATVYPPPFPQGRPIYRSRDRARTWQCISADTERSYGVPLQVHPTDSSVLIAGLARGWPFDWMERPEAADASVVLSRDGGESWTTVAGGLPGLFTAMVEVVTFDRSNPDRVYIGTGGEAMKMVPEKFRRGQIFYSDHLDRDWQQVPIEFPSIYTLTSL